MSKLTDQRRKDIREILLKNLISNYDLGNIDDGGIGGAEETIIALDHYMSMNHTIPHIKNDDPFEEEWNKFHPEGTKVKVIRIIQMYHFEEYINKIGTVKMVSSDLHAFARGTLYNHLVEFDDSEDATFCYSNLEIVE